MDSNWLSQRIDSPHVVGTARLEGYQLEMTKRGLDGSAKANIAREIGSSVWGVVYKIATADWTRLDGFEGGYDRLRVEVELGREMKVRALAYVCTRSEHRTKDLLPFAWYRELLIRGGREHQLPPEYQARLAALPACLNSGQDSS